MSSFVELLSRFNDFKSPSQILNSKILLSFYMLLQVYRDTNDKSKVFAVSAFSLHNTIIGEFYLNSLMLFSFFILLESSCICN